MATADTWPPSAGERAPAFSLPSTSGAPIALGDVLAEARALVAFFPLAFTSTCTAEMCAFTDDFDAFEQAGVTVLPISVDSTATLKEYKAKHAMKTDLLSDFKRDVSRAYGVLLEDRFYSTRAYFLIGQDGVVQWSHVEANPSQRRENSEILEKIAALAG